MQHQVLIALLTGLLPVAALAARETVPCPQKKPGQWYRFEKADSYNKTAEQLTKIDAVEGARLFVTQDEDELVTDDVYRARLKAAAEQHVAWDGSVRVELHSIHAHG